MTKRIVPDIAGTEHRFLIVGGGSIGQRHAANLVDLGAANVLVFDTSPERRERARASGLDAVDSLHGAWEWGPTSTLVCTPTSTHVEVALTAAQHGSHLFIEKPLSHTSDGVARLVEVVAANDLVSLVGCNLRFHPGLQAVRQQLQEGAIGNVVSMRAEFGYHLPDWRPGEDYRQSYSARRELGGGIILDAIHELDYLWWLAGSVQEVACLAGHRSRLEIDTEDVACLLLRFESGVFGEVHLDYVQRDYSRSCKVIGEDGTLEWDFHGEARCYRADTDAWSTLADIERWDVNQMYVDEISHFVRCVVGSERSVKTVQAAAAILELALAAKESAGSGTFVRL